MSKKTSALASGYIIDGQKMDATPEQILSALGAVSSDPLPEGEFDDIIDEPKDPSPIYVKPAPMALERYAEATASEVRRSFPLPYCGPLSRLAVAKAVLDVLFRSGSFKLGDLSVNALWEWDEGRIGSSAAFYDSVSNVAETVEALGIRMGVYSYRSSDSIRLKITAEVSPKSKASDGLFDDGASAVPAPDMGEGRRCPEKALGTPGNWLIYIPFDTGRYYLGGSLFSQALNFQGGKSPGFADPDYFIDSYEVVRELVEDGIARSGVAVGEGGLMTALGKIAGGKALEADISAIMRAGGEEDSLKILFGEIPGALIEIKDFDFDYVDVELLLQDVAYYPIGRFSGADGPLKINTAGSPGIQGILQALLDGASEGED